MIVCVHLSIISYRKHLSEKNVKTLNHFSSYPRCKIVHPNHQVSIHLKYVLDYFILLLWLKIFRTLDKTISSLEMQLASARSAKANKEERSSLVKRPLTDQLKERQKVFFVMGIMTAFSSRKRRDSIRETWMPQGLLK